jgi:hypothetical protein
MRTLLAAAIAVIASFAIAQTVEAVGSDGLVHACVAGPAAADPGLLTAANADGSCPGGQTAIAWEPAGLPGGPGSKARVA